MWEYLDNDGDGIEEEKAEVLYKKRRNNGRKVKINVKKTSETKK